MLITGEWNNRSHRCDTDKKWERPPSSQRHCRWWCLLDTVLRRLHSEETVSSACGGQLVEQKRRVVSFSVKFSKETSERYVDWWFGEADRQLISFRPHMLTVRFDFPEGSFFGKCDEELAWSSSAIILKSGELCACKQQTEEECSQASRGVIVFHEQLLKTAII